jgi:very-short-patch-repair endonuclease
MGDLLLSVVVLVAVISVIKFLARKGRNDSRSDPFANHSFTETVDEVPAYYPYQKEPTLFTAAERSFLGVLEQALANEFRIMGKVRLADIVGVRPGLSNSERQTAFNKISAKHVDFAVFAPDDLSIQFAVELDDSSHGQKARQERDTFLDGVMNAAGIPLVRFPAQKGYSIQEVRRVLSSVLEYEDESPPETEVVIPDVLPPDQNICPKCGGGMVLRKAAKGKNAGQEFWGCSNYPKCRTVLPIPS